jgi:2-hydroxycyclohexanecarboxyl-CoA dehydrogenase
MDLELDRQLVVVTGGASGIGLATTKLFLDEGAHVAVWDLVEPSSDASAALHAISPHWMFCQADVTDQASLDAARDECQRRLGSIQHVVHAAAIGSGKFGFPFTNLTPEDWTRVLEVNVMGMVRVAHCLAPWLKQQASGTLTFLASVAGQMGSQTDPPYSASKAANINFAQCLAKDLAAYGVRVNVVNPGMVQTPLNESVWRAWAATQPTSEHQTYQTWAEAKIRQVVPLQRWQTPADIANAIVFLASSRAANITGQCLNVDGGFVMHS